VSQSSDRTSALGVLFTSGSGRFREQVNKNILNLYNLFNKRARPTKNEPQQGILAPLKCVYPRNLRAIQKPQHEQGFCFDFIIF
jgi:hypothetical protein